MRVVIDSNNIVECDWHLSGAAFAQLISALPRCAHSLHFPQVVIDEVVAAFARRLRELLQEAQTTKRKLQRLTESAFKPMVEDADASGLATRYRQRLLSRIKRAGGDIMPIPRISHDLLVGKGVERRKPFRETKAGVVGYRDALIWESVLLLAEQQVDPVALVTKNWRDFGSDNHGARLHPHLVEDLTSRGIPAERVQLFNGISSFVDKHIRPILESDTELLRMLRENRHPALHVEEWLQSHGREVAWNAFAPGAMQRPAWFLCYSPQGVRRVRDVTVKAVRVVEPLSREVEAEADVEFAFAIPGYRLHVPPPTSCQTACQTSVATAVEYPSTELDMEDPWGGATEWVWHHVHLSLLFDTESQEVQSFDVTASHKLPDNS